MSEYEEALRRGVVEHLTRHHVSPAVEIARIMQEAEERRCLADGAPGETPMGDMQ